jgi:signal transduction histidine kinase
MIRRFCSPISLAAAFAGIATLLIVLAPGMKFAYWSPSLHTTIDTAAAIVSALVAYLVAGRYRRSARLGDLWLLGGLGILATTNLVFSTVPAIAGGADATLFMSLRVAGRFIGAMAFAVAAFAPDIRLQRPGRASAVRLAFLIASLVLLTAVIAIVELPSPLGPDPATSDAPLLGAWNALSAFDLGTMTFFALAAIGFAFRARQATDTLIVWLAAGSTLSAFARLHYFLFPSVDPNWVFSRDILRLAFYLVLLIGAFRDVRAHQERMATKAAIDERRRVARDLHDGLAQELAFISLQSHHLAEQSGEEAVGHIADAADRALHESRAAIAMLMCPAEASLDTAIAEVAQHLTSRCGATLRLDLDPRAELCQEGREHMLRILREAIWNALRHGKATSISVELACEQGMRLRITDNGAGFDPTVDRAEQPGLGLAVMAERSRALGGELRLHAGLGQGTGVEVVLP